MSTLPPQNEKISRGALAMLASALFFSGMGAMLKAVDPGISLFQLVFFRTGISALLILVVMRIRSIPLGGANRPLLLVRALVGFAAMLLNFYALRHIPLGDASVLGQSSPFFVLLLSWLFLRERLSSRILLLTTLGFFGVALMLRPSGSLLNLGGLAALGGAVFAAGAYVSVSQLHKTDSAWTMAFYFMVVAALLSIIPMWSQWQNPDPSSLLLMIGAGVLGTLGQLLMTFAYKHERASWVAPFSYAGVILSFVWGWLFFGEIPFNLSLVGALVILLSGLGMLKWKQR